MVNSSNNSLSSTIFVLGVFLLVFAASSIAGQTTELANGINATIYSAEEIRSDLLTDVGDVQRLEGPDGYNVSLLDDDRNWVPMAENQVLAALEAMQGFTTDLDVDVFVLPAPPAEIGCSFARRGAIYLAPGTGVIPAQTVAYITTHEMGHVLTWAFFDAQPARWDAYLRLRDLDPGIYGPAASHSDRPREILAEDIRFLFGGPLATSSGTIENHHLATPDQVAGLSEMLSGFLAERTQLALQAVCSAFPNPCNPLTTIEMTVSGGAAIDGSKAVLRVFDIRGALVKTIDGGYAANGRISIQWNGTDDSGGHVASGRYVYTMQAGELMARGAVTLIR